MAYVIITFVSVDDTNMEKESMDRAFLAQMRKA